MRRTFVETTVFTKRWNALGLDDIDLLKLQKHLLEHPSDGKLLVGASGARKIRFALPHKGKSGGVRVIYVDVIHDKETHLLLCYAKSKQESLTAEQTQQLKAYIKIIKGEKPNG